MRTIIPRPVSILLLAVILLTPAPRAFGALLSLRWKGSPSAQTGDVTGYNLYLSTHPLSGFDPTAPLDPATIRTNVGNRTNITLLSVSSGAQYYFVVTAVNGTIESDPSNVLGVALDAAGIPGPIPPGGGGGSTNTTGEPHGTTSTNSNPFPTQLNLVGLLPRLSVTRTNGTSVLTIYGAVGATLNVQAANGIGAFQSWTTLSNVSLTTPDPNSPPPGGNALAKAFVPSVQSFPDTSPNSGGLKFYRIYMPMGFAMVADEVLKTKGYTPRLIVTRLPGLNNYIVCYVTQEGVYLDYDDETFVVQTETSGPTIREVATKVASVLQQNWTSASEFTVSNGLKQILATVVKTDSALLDPPLGAPGGVSIPIDF